MTCLVATCVLFLDIGLGASLFSITTSDGTWWQQPFPHSFKTADMAGRIGVGYHFNDHWSSTIDFTRLGMVNSSALFVFDADYDPIGHRCLAHCDKPMPLKARDTLQGGEWSVTYHPVVSSILESILPFVKAGVAQMHSRVTVQTQAQDGNAVTFAYHGWVPMVLAGGGVCYQGDWPVMACAEATYYYGIGSGTMGYPISTRVWVPMVSLQVPLW